MTYQVIVRAVAGALAAAALSGAAFAQSQQQPQPVTMTDTAPLPAGDRSSVGAVILMDQPVLAQREAMLAVKERSAIDTRTMGAAPARVFRDVQVEPLKK
ncbi:MAG: hypothetical protein K0S57_2540 [Ramlibacter sp.]|nr:hypothetical protein [Ramlibacter sp.]